MVFGNGVGAGFQRAQRGEKCVATKTYPIDVTSFPSASIVLRSCMKLAGMKASLPMALLTAWECTLEQTARCSEESTCSANATGESTLFQTPRKKLKYCQ